jgi:hypothetical protein
MVDEKFTENRRQFLGMSMATIAGAVTGGPAMAMPSPAPAQSGTVREPAVIGYPDRKGARGEPVRLVAVVPDTPDQFTGSTPALYREGYEYYRTARAAHPNSPNRYAYSSLPLQMAFFPFDQIETISPRPGTGHCGLQGRYALLEPAGLRGGP